MGPFYPFVLILGIWSVTGLIMPITKSDGSLDISSLLSHLALLEHTVETKASDDEVSQLKLDLAASHKEVAQLRSDFTASQKELTQIRTELEITTTELRTAQADLKKAEVDIAVVKNQPGARPSGGLTETPDHKTESGAGSTFTRWGRTSCPADDQAVYKGYVGGTFFHKKGSGAATILCLPDQPIYDNYTIGGHSDTGHGSTIYGTEYDCIYSDMFFSNMQDEDMPCVVCESSTKTKSIMVPARNVCFPGWTLEYSGYLMGPGDNWATGEYICVDSDPESIPGGQASADGQLLFSVEGKCGSLPCPPYHDNWELTCVVCSK